MAHDSTVAFHRRSIDAKAAGTWTAGVITTMSTQENKTTPNSTIRPTEQLNVLGDECARTILVAASNEPLTAKELTAKTDCSSATVYRRLNDLMENELLTECIRFDSDGSHKTAYEASVGAVHVNIDGEGIDVSLSSVDS